MGAAREVHKYLSADGTLSHYAVQPESGLVEDLEDCDEWYAKERWLQQRYGTVPRYDFYRYLFPEGSFERLGHPEDRKPNGLLLVLEKNDEGRTYGRHLVLTDGLEQLEEVWHKDYVICSPISYVGRSRKATNARFLYALTLDIDYVGLKELEHLDYWSREEIIPTPTFIVNSGHGVHLYYVFENPVPMFQHNQRELRKLKRQLVKQIWTDYTSSNPEAVEALGVVQGFRVVGTRSKLGCYSVSAHQTGERVGISYLNSFVPLECKARISDRDERLTLDEAKTRYPDWYDRVVQGKGKAGRWHVKRDLYDWYKSRIETEATYGHRYFCMMTLAIYAQKCDVSKEELDADAEHFTEVFNKIKPDMPFLREEAQKALEAYNENYVRFPRESVERVTGLRMPANKRNGRKQDQHVKMMNMIRDLDDPEGMWRNKKGAPTKCDLVREYAAAHPEANHSQIARALGVSRPTVIKWLRDSQ